MAEKMTEASEIALERLKVLLNSPQEGIAIKACDSILDRNAETARNRKETVDGSHRFTFDPVTLLHAAVTARELNADYVEKASALTKPKFEPDATKALPESTNG